MHVTVFDGQYRVCTQIWADSVKANGEYLELFITGRYVGRIDFMVFNHNDFYRVEVGRP